jgi:hypothetical protein
LLRRKIGADSTRRDASHEMPEDEFIRRLTQSNGRSAKCHRRIALVLKPPLIFQIKVPAKAK